MRDSTRLHVEQYRYSSKALFHFQNATLSYMRKYNLIYACNLVWYFENKNKALEEYLYCSTCNLVESLTIFSILWLDTAELGPRLPQCWGF